MPGVSARFELIHQQAGAVSRRYEVPPEGLLIGRSAEADIHLQDPLVSRRHARVALLPDGVEAEDLGSRNGIEVNGAAVPRASLGEGDVLTVGGASFRVAKCSDSSLGRTIITPDRAEALYASILEDNRDSRLVVLYRAAQLLGSGFDLDELLGRVLDLVFEALPVRRGFALTLDGPDAVPEIRAARPGGGSGEGPPLSNTLIRHVVSRNEAMLTLDAQDDSRFDASASIVGHDIHAAMCAPLQGQAGVVGALYVDTGGAPTVLSRGDLELLTAIGRVVGIAVENARLYAENVRRERMAAIGEATAGLGHCIKNILTGIRGGGEFINLALAEQNLKYLERGWPILSRAVDRIDMLVMNMLMFSKDRAPERGPTDLNDLAAEVVGVLQPRADKYKVAIRLAAAGDGRTDVDNRMVYRALLNLLINAIEATETDGGNVEVSVEWTPEGHFVHVRDDGPGIAPEIMPRLSEAFVSTKGSSGTGLGLACVYKVAREHGGHVVVESEPGQGARFSIYLPRPEVVGAGMPTAAQRPIAGS